MSAARSVRPSLTICLGATALAAVIVTLAPLASAGSAASELGSGLGVAIRAMHSLVSDGSRRGRPPARPAQPIRYGRDGRFTIMLIGSDWRRDLGGERTDVIMVFTIDPLTGRAAAVSIPRDMVYFPIHRSNGGGNSGTLRVNAIYSILYRDPALPHQKVDRKGMAALARDVGYALGTEVDAWAMLRFQPFRKLIGDLGGIRVDIDEEISDSYYPIHSRRGGRGVHFPRARDYRLVGRLDCRPAPRPCHAAIVYVRSRHGTVGDGLNGDFPRARRQQEVVMAGVERVLDHVGSGVALLELLGDVRGKVITSLPKTPAVAFQLYGLLSRAKLARADRAVLGPSQFAYEDAQTPIYTYKPNLREIRRWVDERFYRVRPPRK